ncbi:MAG: hypothetical protein LBR22_06490 [Desulfovibrio sp.]|nr:hypothetical protein [Desulfovibrio sp.]
MDNFSATTTDRDGLRPGNGGRFRYVYTAMGETDGELLFACQRLWE